MSLSNSLQTVTLGIGAIAQFVKANWLLILIVAVAFSFAGDRFGSWRRDRDSKKKDAQITELQKEQAVHQEERDKWAVERAGMLGQADREHVQGELEDAKEAATKALIAQHGTVVRDAELKKIEAIHEELKRDQTVTAIDISDAERCIRVRAKYAARGIIYQCRP